MNVLNQWLEELYQELQGISEDDRKDILESYEEQINEMIDLKINEREILSKLGSPKKVAQEIKQSFTDTETGSAQNKQIVFNIREKTNDDIVIYTGYYASEIMDKIIELKQFKNIIIKFGRYFPGDTSHYESLLGVHLASDGQYAVNLNEY